LNVQRIIGATRSRGRGGSNLKQRVAHSPRFSLSGVSFGLSCQPLHVGDSRLSTIRPSTSSHLRLLPPPGESGHGGGTGAVFGVGAGRVRDYRSALRYVGCRTVAFAAGAAGAADARRGQSKSDQGGCTAAGSSGEAEHFRQQTYLLISNPILGNLLEKLRTFIATPCGAAL